MRHAKLVAVLIGLLAVGTGIVPILGEIPQWRIDPNAESAPPAVRALGLGFKINNQNIAAPDIIQGLGGRVFVLYPKSAQDPLHGYVLVVDPAAARAGGQPILAAIQVGRSPARMTLSPDGTELWVVNAGNVGVTNNQEASVSVIGLAGLAVTHTIALPDARLWFGSRVTFTPDGQTAYLSSTGTDEIYRLNAGSYALTGRLQLAPGTTPLSPVPPHVAPTALTMSPDGTFLCVTNTYYQTPQFNNNTVSVIDLGTFAERHRVDFRDNSSHLVNFAYYNNVLLSPDGAIGLVASIGSPSDFIPDDRVFLFDPATGQPLRDVEDRMIFIGVDDNPARIEFDPSGRYLIVQLANEANINEQLPGTGIGFPAVAVFTWPELEMYKTLRFRAKAFNMAPTTRFAFLETAPGEYDILFPSFSSFGFATDGEPIPYQETMVRVDMGLFTNCTAVDYLGPPDERGMPVTMAALPDGFFLVANYLTGSLLVTGSPELSTYSAAFTVRLENPLEGEERFTGMVLLNPAEEAVTFRMQAFQSNDTSTEFDDVDAGFPFYWVDDDKIAQFIDIQELTLDPMTQMVSMFRQMNPKYPDVINQWGYLKAVHPTRDLQGVVFYGAMDAETGRIYRGDYLRIGARQYPDAVLPFLFGLGYQHTTIHYVNPFQNQVKIRQLMVQENGNLVPAVGDGVFDFGAAAGLDQVLSDIPAEGYVRVINLDNVDTWIYQTVTGWREDSHYLYACPPLPVNLPTAGTTFRLPFYAVGNGFDTSVVLISINEAFDPTDADGNPLTDSEGYYFAQVNTGWDGTITPRRDGYSFTPAERSFTGVESDLPGQDFTATAGVPTYTLIGRVTRGGTPIPDVLMTGLPGNPKTSATGYYGARVNAGWSGTVTPVLPGVSFNPVQRTYTNVTANLTDQDFSATTGVTTYTIKGKVTHNGEPLADVLMTGLPGTPITDAAGDFQSTLNTGWTGTITPLLTGYTFTPATRTYTGLGGNQENQDFEAETVAVTHTVSGRVTLDGIGLPGVSMTGLRGNLTRHTTDAQLDFYDLAGNLLASRVYTFNNQGRLEVFLSEVPELGADRFDAAIQAGTVVVTVDRDNVCGAFTYQQWALIPNEDEPEEPFQRIQNMAADPLPLVTDARSEIWFPYTITVDPFETSYVLYNPGHEMVTARARVFDSLGQEVGASWQDIVVPPMATAVFFLGDPMVFGPDAEGIRSGFVGYMRVESTNDQPFLAVSVQSSADMLAIIPNL